MVVIRVVGWRGSVRRWGRSIHLDAEIRFKSRARRGGRIPSKIGRRPARPDRIDWSRCPPIQSNAAGAHPNGMHQRARSRRVQWGGDSPRPPASRPRRLGASKPSPSQHGRRSRQIRAQRGADAQSARRPPPLAWGKMDRGYPLGRRADDVVPRGGEEEKARPRRLAAPGSRRGCCTCEKDLWFDGPCGKVETSVACF